MHRRVLRVVLIAACGFSACSDSARPDASIRDVSAAVDARLDIVTVDASADIAPRPYLPIASWQAVPEPADNPSTQAKVELGLQLFHDPVLSADHRVACVTCHGEIWGLSDGLQFSIGIGGEGPPGPGRYGPTHTQRNASTLWNAAFRTGFFWDGRAASLESQVGFPMRSPIELARDPDLVASDLQEYPAYVSLFRAAFPNDSQPITATNLARALAAFERTLVSTNAPFDQWVRGYDRAMGADEVRGWTLFNDVGCASCHTAPTFDSERYEVSFAPTVSDTPDDGRFDVTGVERDRNAFRVPTLRNLRFTGPYFHNGTVSSIDEAVTLEATHRATRELSVDETTALTTFLRTSLADLTHMPSRPTVAPSGLAVPVDTLEIPRWRTDAGQD